MGCNCGKKKIASQPKKIVKSPSQRVVGGGNGSVIKRIIRRAKQIRKTRANNCPRFLFTPL